jgi:hypothetical protein
MENSWVWTADHDISGGAPAGLDVDVKHGLISESVNPTWCGKRLLWIRFILELIILPRQARDKRT